MVAFLCLLNHLRHVTWAEKTAQKPESQEESAAEKTPFWQGSI
jgi:hypothetical protein